MTSLIFQEPFDYTLLSDQGGITLLKHHLGDLFPGLMIESKFWEELKKITERKRGTAKWTPDQFRASAELAEERSQRTPWGQRLPNAKKIQPNWNMKEKLDQERYVESPKAKRRQRQADGADEAAKKKRKKQRLVPGEDKQRTHDSTRNGNGSKENEAKVVFGRTDGAGFGKCCSLENRYLPILAVLSSQQLSSCTW